MTNQIYFASVKEFNGAVRESKESLEKMFKSPIVICNLLNKAISGDVEKIIGAKIEKESLKKVASVIRTLHQNRKHFDICVFKRDVFGRIYTNIRKAENYENEKENLLRGDIVTTNKGNQLTLNDNNDVYEIVPVTLTITSVFNAFAKVAKVDVTNTIKTRKAEEKAAKAKAKELQKLEKARKSVYSLFGDIANLMTDDEILEKYAIIKRTK